ncbi:MAG: DUF4288 domain-containing protein [Verrucomicrobiaceae bacterium]|nr:DUF4288 domain-containing protein [Verrucomicrobiaceae bacterium]
MDFFSARLLYIILVTDGKKRKRNLHDESVVVFRARSFEDAFVKALELGKSRETDYKNDNGHRVRWVLAEILNIDHVGSVVAGKEVASKLHYRTSRTAVSPGRTFHPERSKPNESF